MNNVYMTTTFHIAEETFKAAEKTFQTGEEIRNPLETALRFCLEAI